MFIALLMVCLIIVCNSTRAFISAPQQHYGYDDFNDDNGAAASTIIKLNDNEINPLAGQLLNEPYNCDCFNFTDNWETEIECRCFGKNLYKIPLNKVNKNVNKLIITDSYIKFIKKNELLPFRNTLMDITLSNLPELKVIEKGTFGEIPNLRTLYISHAPQLKFLHDVLIGVTSTKFYSLRIVQTGLYEIPNMSYLPSENIIHLLELDSNKIEKLTPNSLKVKAEQVTLNYNEISVVEDYAFNGSQIAKLNLRGNRKLTKLSSYCFKGLESLRELDLTQTSIESLPIAGLNELETLKIEETPTMKTIPSIYDLENLKVARLTHSFHCCAFKYPEQHDPQRHAQYEKFIKKYCSSDKGGNGGNRQFFQSKTRIKRENHVFFGNYDDNDGIVVYKNILENSITSSNLSDHFDPLLSNNKTLFSYLNPLVGQPIDHEEGRPLEYEETDGTFHSTEIKENTKVLAFCGNLSSRPATSVKCYPEPNALNPCEDIMGFSWLRISVWFVVILSVMGNLAVIIVVLLSGSEITVPRFLMCNLAFADFCMGLYLLLIASMDLHSMGTYFNFAFDWQYGLGCQMAGFLTIFASHLSIFTLAIITVERWFAITYAIYLTKRIRIVAAAKIMFFGWLYSILVAALPLLGVSNYSSTSICLPMEVNRMTDKAYLYFIILVNAVAFGLIVFCYAQIYFSLGPETRRCNSKGEMTIAKKMALLIFTDFATWAPITFFSITALAGYPLIGVTKSKILLVFFYPINSCANPYLYAIMTAQYRRDFIILLSRCGLCRKTANQYTISSTIPTSHIHPPAPLLAKTNGHRSFNKNNDNDTYV